MNNSDVFYNYNIERAILSSFIFDPKLFDITEEDIGEELFFVPFHKKVFQSMNRLQDSQKPVCEEFIIADLRASNLFDDNMFVDILAATPISNIDDYIRELREHYVKRELNSLSNTIKADLSKQDLSDTIIGNIESALLSIASEQKNKNFFSLDEIFVDVNHHIELMQTKEHSLTGIDTGFVSLNAYTSGFNGGDLIILAARPSMGKTALAINMMIQSSFHGNSIAMLSLEMPKDQIALRMISISTGISLSYLKSGKLTPVQLEVVNQSQQKLAKQNIYIDDTPTLTLQKIKSKIKRLKLKDQRLKLVIIDYLQLIDSNSNKDRHLQISEISRGLKLLARELDISILALSQLNRSLESRADKRPMLSDLRESGAIEQDADLIMFVYREDVYKKQEEKQKEVEFRKKGIDFQGKYKEASITKAELIVGKQRNGPIGTIELEFIKENASFREIQIGKSTVFDLEFS